MVKKILGWFVRLVVLFLLGSVLLTVVYKFIPPIVTPLMAIRVVEGLLEGKPVWITKTWKPYEEISPAVFRAVIAAEDGRFLQHTGIDWDAVHEAQRRNERIAQKVAAGKTKRKRLYGASTITMQTAKNAFLPPARNYLRKAFEAYFTYLIEFIWGKKRILEVYVNIIEMGSGVYGVEAAANQYFGKSASALSPREAALLAAILPNPRKWSAAKPSGYIQNRASTIQARAVGAALP